jgi:hypothetical protein
MSQSDLKAFFTRKNHRESYSAISSDKSFVTTVEKIVVVSEESKDIELAIVNAFEIASASQIVLVTRNEMILKKVQHSLQAICNNIDFSY